MKETEELHIQVELLTPDSFIINKQEMATMTAPLFDVKGFRHSDKGITVGNIHREEYLEDMVQK